MAAWIVLALWIGSVEAGFHLRQGCGGQVSRPECADSSPILDLPPAVHVRIDQDGRLSDQQLRVIIEEVEKIWSAAGVRVTSGRYADPVPSRGAIVSMRIVSVQWERDGRQVLGWVTGDLREQQTPTIFISKSGLRDLLATTSFRGLSFSVQPAVLRDQLTAQAMGRVAAHELGHYFLRSRQHDERGLMRPTYSTTDLVAPSRNPFQIPATERVALRVEVGRLMDRQTQQSLIANR